MAGKKSVIETGVDKLVKLVSQYKKISVKQAAKELGVSVSSVEEWSDFLEDEGIINLQSKFATVYLVEKKMGKKEVAEKVKAVKEEKEDFLRRVESSINAVERDSEEIKLIDSEFRKIKGMLEDNFSQLSRKLSDLEDFKKSHGRIERRRKELEEDYDEKIKRVESQLKDEHKEYEKVIGSIDAELKKIKEERDRIGELKSSEKEIHSKVNEINGMIEKIKAELEKENEQLDLDEDRLEKSESAAKSLREEIVSSSKEIEGVSKQVAASRKELEGMEKAFLKDIEALQRGDLDKIGPYRESKHLVEKLKKFFTQTRDVEDMIRRAEREEEEVREHFLKLAKKVSAFSVLTSIPEVKKEMEKLHKELEEIESRKNVLAEQLKKLRSVMRSLVK
jgi:exonuclease SbcC